MLSSLRTSSASASTSSKEGEDGIGWLMCVDDLIAVVEREFKYGGNKGAIVLMEIVLLLERTI